MFVAERGMVVGEDHVDALVAGIHLLLFESHANRFLVG